MIHTIGPSGEKIQRIVLYNTTLYKFILDQNYPRNIIMYHTIISFDIILR